MSFSMPSSRAVLSDFGNSHALQANLDNSSKNAEHIFTEYTAFVEDLCLLEIWGVTVVIDCHLAVHFHWPS